MSAWRSSMWALVPASERRLERCGRSGRTLVRCARSISARRSLSALYVGEVRRPGPHAEWCAGFELGRDRVPRHGVAGS